MSKRPKDIDTATSAEMARMLDLSEASIHAQARRGIMVRSGRGRYLRVESTRRYVRDLRAQIEAARGGTDSATQLRVEKIRLAQEQADKIALENAARRGELLDAGEVERQWANDYRMVSTGMLTVPAQCGQRLPHLTQRDILVIDAEIREKLTELGNSGDGSI